MVESVEKENENIRYKITEERLQRKDYNRIQVQPQSRKGRLKINAFYDFLAEECPDVAADVRDSLSGVLVEEIMKDFRIIWKSNPAFRAKYLRWLEQYAEPNILPEINQIINEYLHPT